MPDFRDQLNLLQGWRLATARSEERAASSVVSPQPRHPRPLTQGMRLWIVFFGWTIIGAFFVGRNIASFVSRDVPVGWHRAVILELTYWYIWALLTPLIFWLASRFPLTRKTRTRNIICLVLFGLFITLFHLALDYVISLSIAKWIVHVSAAELRQVIAGIGRTVFIESFTGLLTYCLILSAYYGFDYYQRYRERERRALHLEGQLAQAELQNLKMQLHPHFLFNTLHTISGLIPEDAQAANRMLVRLSDLLRATLENAGVQEVALKQEIELLQNYLQIEQVRFQDRLTVKISVDPQALDASVPYLILQPLVENAIRHGIAPRAAGGLIEIQARRENGMVQLQVRDNGLGLQADDLDSLPQGLGLTNTRARLEHLYGEAHRFELHNLAEGGVLVSMTFPFHPKGGDEPHAQA